MAKRTKVYFDGGCRPNPGPMEAAVVTGGRPWFFDDLGTGSNTTAEWRALRCAMAWARDSGLTDAVFLGDSLEVVRQAILGLTTGQAGSEHAAAFLALLEHYRPGRIRWIKREQNLAGIALAKRRGC